VLHHKMSLIGYYYLSIYNLVKISCLLFCNYSIIVYVIVHHSDKWVVYSAQKAHDDNSIS
jgi:hypothetical protein